MFGEMDFCQLCGGYDTIQTYYKLGKVLFHVCEKCDSQGQYITAEKLMKKYKVKGHLFLTFCNNYMTCGGYMEECGNCNDCGYEFINQIKGGDA